MAQKAPPKTNRRGRLCRRIEASQAYSAAISVGTADTSTSRDACQAS